MTKKHGSFPSRVLVLSLVAALTAPSLSHAAPKKKSQAAAKKTTAAQKKKTVSQLLAQARDNSRGGGIKLQKAGTALPQSQLAFGEQKQSPNLESVKPPRSSELMNSEVTGDQAAYIKVLNQQINELYKLTQKFKNSANRGEMWLRLAELYVEKSTILDNLAQDEYDRKLKQYQQGKLKTKPQLDLAEAREFNKKSIQLYEWFERDFPKDEKISQAYFFLGFNYFELGNVKKGVEYYEKLTQRFPNSPFVMEAYFALGEYYFENEKWAQAYKQYSPLLKEKRHRLHTFALYKSAWCLYRLGKNKEGLNYLEVIIKSGRQETGSSLAGRRTVNRSRLESEALRDIVPFYAAVGSSSQAGNYFKTLVGGDVTPYLEKLAYYYSDKGNREGSDEVFKQLIAQNPSHPKAFEYQYQIVQNYFYAKNSPKFREELYRWVNDYGPNSSWSQANAGNKALVANAQKLRETTLRNWVLQQHQTAQNSRAPYSQAMANEGYQLYLKEFANTEGAPDMHFYYGELLYDMGKFDEAAVQYQWLVENSPKSKFADKAAANLILAVEKGVPDDKELAKRVGDRLEPVEIDEKTARFIKAGRWYASRFPNSEKVPEIRFRIGRLYYQTNHFDEAAAEFKDIVQKHPKTKYAEYSANLLLDIYNLRKDYAGLEKAGSELLAVPSIASSKAGSDIRGVLEKANFKKAQDLEVNKDYGGSAAQFEAFALQNPSSTLAVTALFNAGVNYERAGDSARAQANYEKVLASNDSSAASLKPKTRRLLAKLAQDSYRTEEAARLYKQLAVEAPKDPLAPNMMFNAAILYQMLGRPNESVKAYDDFIRMSRKHQDNLEAVFQMAKIHDKAGQKTAAINRYKEYLNGGPSDAANVMEATGRLYELSASTGSGETEAWRNRTLAVSRRLANENKKFDPAWPAKARLGECEQMFNDLKAIRFPRDPAKLKGVLEQKVDLLNRLVKHTGEVIKYNSAEQIVDALALSGRAYDHMAQSLRAAPLPAGLSADEEKQYREGVEKQFVEPNLAKAREFFEKTVSRAWELDAYTPAYRQALSAMNKIDPKTYYNNGEVVSDARYVNWMSQ